MNPMREARIRKAKADREQAGLSTAMLPLYGSPEDIRAAILVDLSENAGSGFWARLPENMAQRLGVPLPTVLAELLVLECAGQVRRWAGSAYELLPAGSERG